MARSIGSIIAGFLVGAVLVSIVELTGHAVYPLPEGLDPQDIDAIKAYVADAPVGALLFVLAAWAVGSFGGAAMAAFIARRAPIMHGLIVGGILLAAGVANLVAFPHPLWFTIVGVLEFLPMAWLGAATAKSLVNKPGESA